MFLALVVESASMLVGWPAVSTPPPVATPVPTDVLSTYLAPGGGLAAIAGVLAYAANTFAKGRRERVVEAEAEAQRQSDRREKEVGEERKRRELAEDQREVTTGELRKQIEELQQQIKKLQQEVTDAREDFRRAFEEQESRHRHNMATQEDRHRDELVDCRVKAEREMVEAVRLRRLLLAKEIDPDTGEPIPPVRPAGHGVVTVEREDQ